MSQHVAAFLCSPSPQSLILISFFRVTNYSRNAFSRRSMLFNDNDNDVDPLTFRFSAQMPPPVTTKRTRTRVVADAAVHIRRRRRSRSSSFRPGRSPAAATVAVGRSRSVGTSERRKQQRGGGGAIEGARTSSTFRGPTLISTLKVRDVFRTFSLPGKWKTQCALFSNYFDRFKTNIVSFIGKIPFPVRPCNRWAPFRFGQTNGGRFAAEKAMARYR